MPQTVAQRTDAAETAPNARSRSENCARIKDLGFTAPRHITVYGEHFEIVSDPFSEGDCIAVHAISEGGPGHHPTIRSLRLPIAILVSKSVHN
jgi:hypothetical protein